MKSLVALTKWSNRRAAPEDNISMMTTLTSYSEIFSWYKNAAQFFNTKKVIMDTKIDYLLRKNWYNHCKLASLNSYSTATLHYAYEKSDKYVKYEKYNHNPVNWIY